MVSEDLKSGYEQVCPAVRTRNKALIAIQGEPTPGHKTLLWIPNPKGKRQAALGERPRTLKSSFKD